MSYNFTLQNIIIKFSDISTRDREMKLCRMRDITVHHTNPATSYWKISNFFCKWPNKANYVTCNQVISVMMLSDLSIRKTYDNLAKLSLGTLIVNKGVTWSSTDGWPLNCQKSYFPLISTNHSSDMQFST